MVAEISLLAINTEQCRRLAKRLRGLEVHANPYLKTPANETERCVQANYWFYVIAICQSTRMFQGKPHGRWVRGFDYLVEASQRCMEEFTAERMKTYTAEALKVLLSDDFDPSHSPIDRVEERVEQLHDCACRLLRNYGGEAMAVYERSGGRLAGEGGLLALLAEFAAYSDPLQKKSMVLAGMLHESGLWPLCDPQNLKVAMDYHIMRVALRSGMVKVKDMALARDLRERNPVSDELDQAVRTAVSAACDVMVQESGLSVHAFDKLMWHLGRSCCFYEHDPMCGPRRKEQACFKHSTCTLVKATTHACSNTCILDGVCKGSRDPGYRMFWETNVYTVDY